MKTQFIALAALACMGKLLVWPDWYSVTAFVAAALVYAFMKEREDHWRDHTDGEVIAALDKLREDIDMIKMIVDTKIEAVAIDNADVLKLAAEVKKMVSEHHLSMGFPQFRTRAQRQGAGG